VAANDPVLVTGAFGYVGNAVVQQLLADGRRAADDAAVLIALGTPVDDDLARLRAGEATSLVLLAATALGLASCAASQALEIPEIREEIRDDVFGSTGFPQMLLRLGWAPFNADPLPVTPRRELSDVVDRLDGAPFT
jgi:nitroreductase